MLKQAYIVLLLLFIGLWGKALACAQDSTDTIRRVAVKVTLIPIKEHHKPLNTPNSEPERKKNRPPYTIEKRSPNSRITTVPEAPSHLGSRNTIKEDPVATDTVDSTVVDDRQIPQSPNPQKKGYFFSGLLLLVVGIIITLFFRAGFSVVIGIALIVAGYYILIYSLLFMS